jgi:hypothetical protein
MTNIANSENDKRNIVFDKKATRKGANISMISIELLNSLRLREPLRLCAKLWQIERMIGMYLLPCPHFYGRPGFCRGQPERIGFG